MQLAHQLTIADYAGYARAHPTEIQALFDDLLISVTSFFRDPDSWAALQAQVIGPLVEGVDAEHQIRAGCPAVQPVKKPIRWRSFFTRSSNA